MTLGKELPEGNPLMNRPRSESSTDSTHVQQSFSILQVFCLNF
jgi:hypothetical protein